MNLRTLRLRAVVSLGLLALLVGCATAPSTPPAPAPVADAASAPASAASAPATVLITAAPPAAASAPASEGPMPTRAVDPLRPEAVVDPDDAAARSDLWQRVRNGFKMADLETTLVRSQERWYASRPDYVARMTERSSRYLFHIVEEIERRGMPTELALLPFIESAFNPQAISVARASGMWQFIPSTGQSFDLAQNIFRDDRRDVLASTRAALDYLSKLHGMFGDWHLALAAYNWGEGNVMRAMKRNERAGKPIDYLSLRMPDETRNYVPKLQAVKNIVLRPQDFALELPPLQNHPYFLAVPIERDIDVAVAVRLAGIEVDEFKALNPQMNKPVILAAGTPRVLLPYDNANQFVRAVKTYEGPMSSWTAWVAPKTMSPTAVAKEVGMSESQLREINRIPPGMLVRSGSTLLVPRSEQLNADVDGEIADNAMIAFAPDAPPARRVVVKVGKRGDSVAGIARRYGVSSAQVARWNGVSASTRFKAGETAIVYVAQKATTKRRSTASVSSQRRSSSTASTARGKRR